MFFFLIHEYRSFAHNDCEQQISVHLCVCLVQLFKNRFTKTVDELKHVAIRGPGMAFLTFIVVQSGLLQIWNIIIFIKYKNILGLDFSIDLLVFLLRNTIIHVLFVFLIFYICEKRNLKMINNKI